MLDIQVLRSDLDGVAARLASRGFVLDTVRFGELEGQRKALQVRTQELQAKRNASSKLIGQAKARGEDTASVMAEVAGVGDALKQTELQLDEVLGALQEMLEGLPNMPHESVPVGLSEADNVEVRRVGVLPAFDFAVKDHVELGEGLGGLDFETATKISG
ncbi:MAG: serine--tRNA ligase, partial [Gallionellales bacterium CG_4_8_14_3_um_filter_54_18]